jgi:hypothetical protein
VGLIAGEWRIHAGAAPSAEFQRQARFIRESLGEEHKAQMATWLAGMGDGWDAEHLLQRAREL